MVDFFTTDKQVPPSSLKVRAETLPSPFVCSTTSRFPAASNSMDRGEANPVAISCARKPDAIDGTTEFAGVSVVEQLEDCEAASKMKDARIMRVEAKYVMIALI